MKFFKSLHNNNKKIVNDLSNSVIKDIDNLKAIIKKPIDSSKLNDIREKFNYNGSTEKEKDKILMEENGEQVNEFSHKGMKRNLSDYVKVYKPAKKVKKNSDNNKDIEIYFSEKSDNDLSIENGNNFQEDEYETNLNYQNQIKEFERNSSKLKFKSMMIVKNY